MKVNIDPGSGLTWEKPQAFSWTNDVTDVYMRH